MKDVTNVDRVEQSAPATRLVEITSENEGHDWPTAGGMNRKMKANGRHDNKVNINGRPAQHDSTHEIILKKKRIYYRWRPIVDTQSER